MLDRGGRAAGSGTAPETRLRPIADNPVVGRFAIDEAVVFGLTHLRRAEVFLSGLDGDVPSGDD